MFEGTAQEIIELMEYLTTNPAFVIQTAIAAALSLGVFVMVGVIFWKVFREVTREFEDDPFFNPRKRDRRK